MCPAWFKQPNFDSNSFVWTTPLFSKSLMYSVHLIHFSIGRNILNCDVLMIQPRTFLYVSGVSSVASFLADSTSDQSQSIFFLSGKKLRLPPLGLLELGGFGRRFVPVQT